MVDLDTLLESDYEFLQSRPPPQQWPYNKQASNTAILLSRPPLYQRLRKVAAVLKRNQLQRASRCVLAAVFFRFFQFSNNKNWSNQHTVPVERTESVCSCRFRSTSLLVIHTYIHACIHAPQYSGRVWRSTYGNSRAVRSCERHRKRLTLHIKK